MHKKKGISVWSEESTCWDSEMEAPIENCSLVKCPIVYLSLKTLGQIQFLMNKYPEMEWAADCVGEKKGGDFYIDSLYIFKQTVSVASVKREEPPCKGAIGVTHSHHGMSSTFSSVDDKFPNSNHNLSGVICFSEDEIIPFKIKFTARLKTPCGKTVRFDDIPVRYLLSPFEVNTRDKIKESKEKIYPLGFGIRF